MSRHGNTAASPKKRGYIDVYRPSSKTRQLLDQARSVLEEYRNFWPLTCRQIFYRLVAAQDYAKNERAYSRLCHHLANARRGRLIPFNAVRDDGVSTIHLNHFAGRDDFLSHVRDLGENYTANKMANQNVHAEVHCESTGMLPQLHRVCERYSVPVYSSGGFDSVTAKKNLADRICDIGKPTVILHPGHYDPSGQSIFKALEEDVTAFVNSDRPHNYVFVAFERVALTQSQIESYALPTSPAKITDSRSAGWKESTCQLEALPPDAIAKLLDRAIRSHIDPDILIEDYEAESQDRVLINRLLPGPVVRK